MVLPRILTTAMKHMWPKVYSVTVFVTSFALLAGASFALAPKSRFPHVPTLRMLPADALEVIPLLASALKAEPDDIKQAIRQLSIPDRQLTPLLQQLHYLMHSRILSEEEVGKLARQPLPRVTKLLLVLAWQMEFDKPWKITIEKNLNGAWESYDLKTELATHKPPDAATLALVKTSTSLIPFSLENFFSHPMLGSAPKDVVAKVENMVKRNPALHTPRYVSVLTMLFLDPRFSRDVSRLFILKIKYPGIENLLKRIWEIRHETGRVFESRMKGIMNELTHLEPTLESRGFEIKELNARILDHDEEEDEIDVVAVKNNKIYFVEIKSIDLTFAYNMYPEREEPLTTHAEQQQFRDWAEERFLLTPMEAKVLNFELPVEDLLRDAFFTGMIKRKVNSMRNAASKNLLDPLFGKYPNLPFGGIIFSLTITNDPHFEKLIRARARELSGPNLMPIEIRCLGREGPVGALDAVGDGEHPNRYPAALRPPEDQLLWDIFENRENRESLERLQAHVLQETSSHLGIKTLSQLSQRADTTDADLTHLIATQGTEKLLAWRGTNPFALLHHAEQDQSSMTSMRDRRPKTTCLGSKILASTCEIAPHLISIKDHEIFGGATWKKVYEFFATVPNTEIHRDLERNLWEILEYQTWICPHDRWPEKSRNVALHLADGRALINARFFQSLPTDELKTIALIEEALFELLRRGTSNTSSLLAWFQKKYREERKIIEHKVQSHRGNKTIYEAKMSELTQVEKILENLFSDTGPMVGESLSMQQWAISIDAKLRRLRTLAADWRPNWKAQDWEDLREQLLALQIEMRAYGKVAEETILHLAVTPIASSLPEYSLQPFMSPLEKDHLRKVLVEIKRQLKEMNERFATLPRASGKAMPFLDPALLEQFERHPSPAVAAQVIAAYREACEQSIKMIHYQIGLALSVTKNSGVDKNTMTMDEIIKNKRFRDAQNDVTRMRKKWTGEKNIKKHLEPLQPFGTYLNEEDRAAAIINYPIMLAAIWGVEAENVLSLGDQTSDIPAFQAFLDHVADFETFTNKMTRFAISHRRWVEHDFDAAERAQLRLWSEKALALVDAVKENLPVELKIIGGKPLEQDFEKLKTSLHDFAESHYTFDLSKRVEELCLLEKRFKEALDKHLKRQMDKSLDRFLDMIVSDDLAPRHSRFENLPRTTSFKKDVTFIPDRFVLLNKWFKIMREFSVDELLGHYATLKGINVKSDRQIVDDILTCFALWGTDKVTHVYENERTRYCFHTHYYRADLQLQEIFKAMENFLREGHAPLRPSTDPEMGTSENVEAAA